MVDLVERIDTLLMQECTVYRTEDYLAPSFQTKLPPSPLSALLDQEIPGTVNSSTTTSSGINEVWREKICEWSYQVIDHFDFSREVVAISVHYLDRYLSTRTVDKRIFQLIAMTTLYLAIKLHDQGIVSMGSMIELSRGYFLVKQMEEMELEILGALEWKLHPPTAYCFAKHLLFLLPYNASSLDARQDVLELARFLCELSVIDYFFVPYRPSVVALSTLLNAMELVEDISDSCQREFVRELEQVHWTTPVSKDVLECRDRLRILYAQGGYSCPGASSGSNEREPRNDTISPVSVVQTTSFFDKSSR